MTLDEASAKSIEGEGDLTARKNVEILTEYSQREPQRQAEERAASLPGLADRRSTATARSSGIEIVHNELHVSEDGSIRPRATDRTETLECGLVLRSIGYRGVALDGVPFDERAGTIPNTEGCIHDPDSGEQCVGEYCAGWIKRGPTGVIGTNKKDAQETVDRLLADAAEGKLLEPSRARTRRSRRWSRERKPDFVSYARWRGDRRARALARRAAGSPARQALHARGAARGRSEQGAAEPAS